jgi:hypothetical protein
MRAGESFVIGNNLHHLYPGFPRKKLSWYRSRSKNNDATGATRRFLKNVWRTAARALHLFRQTHFTCTFARGKLKDYFTTNMMCRPY